MDPSSQPKTLYVGNLDPSVTEELIMALFGQMGPVKGCKIIREMPHYPNAGAYPPPDPYAFVEFANHDAALAALTAMNKRQCMNRELRVNWAANSGAGPGQGGPGGAHGFQKPYAPKVDTSSHHHIFVGDLSPEIETETLRNAFAPFGEISDCRVVRDPTTLKSKGYGFCSFIKKVDAQTAIEQMNGQFLGSRSIRTNWATRKPPPLGSNPYQKEGGGSSNGGGSAKPLDYDTVFNQASDMNHTVYVGGLADSDDNQIRRGFSTFGRIQEVRYFKDKGYAFVRYDNKESACNAIVALNMTELSGSTIKCSWGKEGGGNPQPQGYGGPPQGGGYPPQGGYGGYQGGQQYYQQPPQQYMYQPQQGYMMQPGGQNPQGGGGYYPNPYDYQAAGGGGYGGQ